MRVAVVGAGFAGLTAAYYLQKRGFDVTIYEKQEHPGGLIGTVKTAFGQVETAANALLADKNAEDLFVDLGVDFAPRTAARKKRYIFWDKPSRWPLTWGTSWLGFKRLCQFMVTNDKSLMPESEETIHDWAVRVVNIEFAERLLAPALQGIYAGDPRRMSASLLIQGLSRHRPPRGYYKGSISPIEGMGELIAGLRDHLETAGVLFQLQTSFAMPEYITNPIVLATSAWSAADILGTAQPAAAKILRQCESLALVRATAFFPRESSGLDGFGCLFPASRGFRTLGVLFDSCVFPNRSQLRAESWIMGGAANPDIAALSDEQVVDNILHDRRRLPGGGDAPVHVHITRWSRAIPHYTVEWESALKSLRVNPPLYLHGNYLGQLGLSRILHRSMQLAAEIKENYG